MAVVVYIKMDLMLRNRNRSKIETNAAQLRFRYVNLAHIKSVSNKGGYCNRIRGNSDSDVWVWWKSYNFDYIGYRLSFVTFSATATTTTSN